MRKPKGAAAAASTTVGTIDDVIVDDNGNPISPFASDDVVDDNGNPVLAPRHPMVAAVADKPVSDPTRPPTPSMSRPPKTVGGFLANIPKSAVSMLGSVGEMVLNPIDTVTGIKDVVVGGLQKMPEPGLPLDPFGVTMFNKFVADKMPDKQPVFDAFATGMKERYGGVNEIGNTLYEDPTGAALDISGLLSLGSTAVAGRMPATARFLRTASETIDPLRQGGRAIIATGRGTRAVARGYLGKSTGVGAEVIKEASKGSEAFKAGMRGDISHADAMDNVFQSVSELKDRRRVSYQAQLAGIDQSVVLDIQPVVAETNVALSRFNISVTVGKKGVPQLDFSRSALRHSPQEMAKVSAMYEDVLSWGNRPNDLSPLGFDILKQGLDEMVAASPGRGDAIVQAVKDSVRNELNTNVPGYAEMTADYAIASKFLDEIQVELSARPGGKPGAGIRKLATALNQRADYRKSLIETVDLTLGTDIKGAIAGLEMQELTPRGLVGPIAVGAGGTALFSKLSSITSNPQTLLAALAGAATFSPRLVGETLAGIATVRRSAAGQALGMAVDEGKRFVFNPATYRITEETKEQRKGKEKEIPKNWWLPDMPQAPASLMPMNTNSMLPEMPKPPNDTGAAGNSEDPIASAKEWMSKYGITMEQSTKYLPGVSELLYKAIDPASDYDTPALTKQAVAEVFKNITHGRAAPKEAAYGALEDAWSLYLGMPQQHGSFGISDYRPSRGKGDTPYYYKIENFIDTEGGSSLSAEDRPNTIRSIVESIADPRLRDDLGAVKDLHPALYNFHWSKGRDARGHYIAYYDKWDLAPIAKAQGKIISVPVEKFIGGPLEIYDRIYYDPKTFEPKTAKGQR